MKPTWKRYEEKDSICHLSFFQQSLCSVRGQGHASSPDKQLKEQSRVYLQSGQGSCKRSTHHNLSTLLRQVRDGRRGEVEVASFERPQNHSVGHITCSEGRKLRKIVAFHQRNISEETGQEKLRTRWKSQSCGQIRVLSGSRHPAPSKADPSQAGELHRDPALSARNFIFSYTALSRRTEVCIHHPAQGLACWTFSDSE